MPEEFTLIERHLGAPPLVKLVREGYPDAGASPRQGPITERSVLIGYSWGSLAALRDATRHPKHVAGVFLIAPYLFPRKKLGALKSALLQAPLLGNALLGRAGKKIIDEMFEKSCSPQGIPTTLWQLAEKMARPEVLKQAALEKERPGLSGEQALTRLGEIGIPIGVVFGAQDLSSPEAEQIAPIRSRTQLLIDHRLDQAGHAIPWTHPREAAEALRDFLLRSSEN
jgi:pimeloyl-ACP methyl ester carboxylesterase